MRYLDEIKGRDSRTDEVLVFENVSAEYPMPYRGIRTFHKRVLHDLNFSARPAEIIGIVGPNGAGKSTLLRLAAGLLLPSTGTIRLHGKQSKSLDGDQPLIGVSFADERSFAWRLTVRQNLELFAGIYQIPRHDIANRINFTCELCGLTDYFSRPVWELSTGFRQRLALCRALLHEPSVLLLDEPSRALDFSAKRAMHDTISLAMQETRLSTVLISSHDLEEVGDFCSTVLALVDGRIRYRGAPSEFWRLCLNQIKIKYRSPMDVCASGRGSEEKVLEETINASDPARLASLFAGLAEKHARIREMSVEKSVQWEALKRAHPMEAVDTQVPAQAVVLQSEVPRSGNNRASSALRQAAALMQAEVTERMTYKFDIALRVLLGIVLATAFVVARKSLAIGSVETTSGAHVSYLTFLVTGLLATGPTLKIVQGIPLRVRKCQVQGTLEALFAAGCSVWALVTAFCCLEIAAAVLGTIALLAFSLISNIPISFIGIVGTAIIALSSLPCFIGLSLFSVGICLTQKRGDPVGALFSLVSFLAAGVAFPISAAPRLLQRIADALPLTIVVDAGRKCLLSGSFPSLYSTELISIAIYDIICLTAGALFIRRSLQSALKGGTLAQY